MSYRDTVALVSAFQSLRSKPKKSLVSNLEGFKRRIQIGEDAPKADFKGVGTRRATNYPILRDIAVKIAKGELHDILDLTKDKFWVIHFKASKGSLPVILPVTNQKMLMDLYNSTSDDMLTNPDMDYVAAFDKTAKDFPSPVQEVTPTEFITETKTEPGTVQTKEVVREITKEVGGGGAGVAIVALGALGIAAVASKKKR